MLYSILISAQILIAIGLIALILLQQGRGADAGAAFGSGASQTVFGARGSASFLTRMTALFAFLFLSNSFFLAYLSSRTVERPSLIEQVARPGAVEDAGIPGDGPPAAPGDVPQDVIDALNESLPEEAGIDVVPPDDLPPFETRDTDLPPPE